MGGVAPVSIICYGLGMRYYADQDGCVYSTRNETDWLCARASRRVAVCAPVPFVRGWKPVVLPVEPVR